MSNSYPLICESNSYEFGALIGFLIGLIMCFDLLVGKQRYIEATDIFTRGFAATIPPEPNLDKADFAIYFSGSLAQNFIIVYKKLLSVWKQLQEIMLNERFSGKHEANYLSLRQALIECHAQLMDLSLFFG